MPIFPTYEGELPSRLNPLNLRHYWLLAYWIFFRPTALKCYLYQADPVLYRTEGGVSNFIKSFRNPAYLSLWLQSVLLVFLISLLTNFISDFITVLGEDFPRACNVREAESFLKYRFYLNRKCAVSGILSGPLDLELWLRWLGEVVPSIVRDVAVGVAGGVGAIRLPFFLAQLTQIFNPFSQKHPIAWDELSVLPSPRTRSYLMRQLRHDEQKGLGLLSQLLSNPFQYWAAQAAGLTYLHRIQEPLQSLYSWQQSPILDSYCRAPVSGVEWRDIISRRQLLFGELAGLSINEKGSLSDSNLIYQLTRSRRELKKTPLTQFIRLIYSLLYETDQNPIIHLQSRFWQTGFDYPNSQEIIESFDIITQYLTLNSLQEIADSYKQQTWSIFNRPPKPYIRPTVIEALSSLGRLAFEIRDATTASSRTNQLAILARTDASLQTLHYTVTTQVPPGYPEQKLLHRIIDQWREIITTAAGALGQAQLLEPVPNPYIVGNPVSGQLFVGRDDILARIEELWRPTGQLPSIILYGHRRMGKTSILQNLTGHLGPHTRIIDFNMQRVGMVRSDGELLHNLALALYDTLPDSTEFPEPTEPTFTQQNPYAAFDRFLKQLNPHRNQTRYIIALDEFELLEQRIHEGRLDRELLTYLRSLINTYPWFILALAGLHSLQEMTHDYWSPLFGNVTPIPVSFLSRNAATNLITNPTDDFPIDYDPDAIAEIYTLTGGQPYLLQLICHNLVSRYNHQRFEDNIDIEPRFSLADVQTIINSPTFFSQGHAYFSGIWSQANEQHGPTQHAILRTLSQSPSPEVELLQDVQLLDHYAEALELLQRHDIIHRVDDRHQFVVPLMQRWVAQCVNPD